MKTFLGEFFVLPWSVQIKLRNEPVVSNDLKEDGTCRSTQRRQRRYLILFLPRSWHPGSSRVSL